MWSRDQLWSQQGSARLLHRTCSLDLHMQRVVSMQPINRLSTFFKEGDTEFGVFYPKHYLLAVFPNLVEADLAKEERNHAGHVEEDVISVSGEEVVHFAEDHALKDGLSGLLMTKLSRMFGTKRYTRKGIWRRRKRAQRSWPCIVPRRRIKSRRGDSSGPGIPWWPAIIHLVESNI
jgi:hypothetical protein